jgi:hypothetical protein
MAAGEHLWRHGRATGPCRPAPRREAPTTVPRGGRAIFIFYFFIFKTLLTFKKNNKLISVSIITREYHNQRVDANSLYKIMVKVLLHLNALVPLRHNSFSASPGVVPVVRPGVKCPDNPRSELVGRRCRHDRLLPARSIRCPSARRCRSAGRRGRSAQWLCRLSPNWCMCQL